MLCSTIGTMMSGTDPMGTTVCADATTYSTQQNNSLCATQGMKVKERRGIIESKWIRWGAGREGEGERGWPWVINYLIVFFIMFWGFASLLWVCMIGVITFISIFYEVHVCFTRSTSLSSSPLPLPPSPLLSIRPCPLFTFYSQPKQLAKYEFILHVIVWGIDWVFVFVFVYFCCFVLFFLFFWRTIVACATHSYTYGYSTRIYCFIKIGTQKAVAVFSISYFYLDLSRTPTIDYPLFCIL